MGAVTRHIVEESSKNRSAGQHNWSVIAFGYLYVSSKHHSFRWRPLEAAFSALGSNTEPVLDTLEDEVDAGREKPIDVEWLLRDIVPSLLVLSGNITPLMSALVCLIYFLLDFPFLQGRAFVLASQYSKLLPADHAAQYLDASVQVLEASGAGVPVKISAIKAIQKYATSDNSRIEF